MTTATQPETAPVAPLFPPLTHADRCDGNYSSQALVRLVRGVQDLTLSAHYYNQSEATLLGQGWSVFEDIREAVLNPPKTSFDTSSN